MSPPITVAEGDATVEVVAGWTRLAKVVAMGTTSETAPRLVLAGVTAGVRADSCWPFVASFPA